MCLGSVQRLFDIMDFATQHSADVTTKGMATIEEPEASSQDQRTILRGRTPVQAAEGSVRSRSGSKKVTFADQAEGVALFEVIEFPKEESADTPVRHSACCQAW